MSQKILEMRQSPEISKVNSMFEEHMISTHYGKFQKKALEILEKEKAEEEAAEKRKVEELQKEKGVSIF